jgi:circadian clock protein KaiB
MPKTTRKKAVLLLRLYVAGQAPNSLNAIGNVKAICATHFQDAYKIEIIDMLQNPLRALADGIIVTPTLLKLAPPPVRRLIGNLSDASQLLFILANK